MSSDKDNGSNKVSFSKVQKASNDLFTGLLTEDNAASGIRILDVMANDQGSGKSLYSLDDGSNSLKDLLTQDLSRTAPQSTDKSAMGATIWITSDGKVGYDASSFSAATLAKLNHLSAGESLTDTFTYAISLSDGTLSWATASVKIDGANDPVVITSGAQNGVATEIADGALGENTTTFTSSGVITFTDADKHDSHTMSVTPNGAGYLGTFKAYLTDGDDDDRRGDDDGHHNDGDRRGDDHYDSSSSEGAIKWKFAVNDSAIDHLAAGQTLTQTYNVVINDGHGGAATQVVTIALTGTNDAPVITSAAQSGNVSEGDDGANMTATGQVTFSDVDLIDNHNLSVSIAATHGTASVDANGIWHYTVNDNGVVDALAAGMHLADSFTVKVDDHHGGIAAQVVSIDIAGTNDAPVVHSPFVYKTVSEDDGLKFETATEFLTKIQAVDPEGDHLSMVNFTVTATDAGNPVAIPQGALTVTSNVDGTFASATLDTGKFDYLQAGEKVILTADYDVVDGHGGSTHAQGIKTIVGVNDAALISGDAAGSVTEDGTLTTGGMLTVSDVDTGEAHFQTPVSLAGTYGAFTFDATTGAWGYGLNNDAANVQALGATDLVHDTLTVASQDGTASQVIDVAIHGAAEAQAQGPLIVAAYINNDGINGYNPNADTLIAGVFDTNGDGIVSAGDTLRTDFYPLDFNASHLGEFTHKDHIVTSVDSQNSSDIVVFTADDNSFLFRHNSFTEGFVAEKGGEVYVGVVDEIIIDDIFNPFPQDAIYVIQGASPTYPDTAADVRGVQPGSQAFIDVDIGNIVPVNTQLSFRAATSFAVGGNPVTGAIGDLNGDGKLDIAVTNAVTESDPYVSKTVSVLFGNGDGTFGAATNLVVGDHPFAVAIGDLNGDGKLDLAVTNQVSNDVSVLLGNGNGTFGAATSFAVGAKPLSIAIGDLNGDGKLDLTTANFLSNNVSVLLGNGDGTFGAATNLAVGTSPFTVALGDLNGDGKLDLAVTNQFSNDVSVLLGNGDGTFGMATNVTAGTMPASIAIADLNGDGKFDLAVTNYGDNDISVLLGNGDGTFGVATNFAVGAGPTRMAIADLNGDGKLDITTTNFGFPGNDVSVLLGNGNGSFGAATNFAVGANPTSVLVGDLNGDGKLDLTVPNYSSGDVSVLLNAITNQPTANVFVMNPEVATTLTGGAGNDTFVFNSSPQVASTVTDFTAGADHLQIFADGFNHGLVVGTTPMVVNTADLASASSPNPGSNGYFIFDNTGPNQGTVYWDANGGSGADATALVVLQGVTSLLPSDFHIV